MQERFGIRRNLVFIDAGHATYDVLPGVRQTGLDRSHR